MPKTTYVKRRFSTSSQEIIEHADDIISTYQAQGLTLTLRQLYYRFIAGDLLPNTQRDYKRLGSIINDARLAGLIDWDAIEDRGRHLLAPSHWDSPGDIISSAASSYALDKWAGQDQRVEIWVEKEALIGVVERACEPLDVPCFACKGYVSQSEMWRASLRFLRYRRNGWIPTIIHLGDHDPSGIDMTRDIRDRLSTFGIDMEIERIALNMNQVEEYDPPPNPAKQTDSRASGYIEEYGYNSWELDALEPAVLNDLIQNAIREHLDQDLFDVMEELQEKQRETLEKAAACWEDVAGFLKKKGRK